jgi:hypothetical protein
MEFTNHICFMLLSKKPLAALLVGLAKATHIVLVFNSPSGIGLRFVCSLRETFTTAVVWSCGVSAFAGSEGSEANSLERGVRRLMSNNILAIQHASISAATTVKHFPFRAADPKNGMARCAPTPLNARPS